jgi:hypothetical protein
MSVLVVYYSLSGTTRAVATALASELGADIEEIRCGRYSPRFGGFLRAAYDSWRGNLPAIEPLAHVPSRYDLLVVGGPVWAWNACTPVRVILRRAAHELSNAAFFVTVGGVGFKRALRTMETLAGLRPAATLVVRTKDVEDGNFGTAVASFASALRRDKAA